MTYQFYGPKDVKTSAVWLSLVLTDTVAHTDDHRFCIQVEFL